jgi:hypothetical protein
VNPERVREVLAGLRTLASRVDGATGAELHRLADLLSTPVADDDAHLTPRELDVLAQVALGCSNAEAAQRLSLKPETVKSYLRSAAAKLGRTAGMRRCRRRGGPGCLSLSQRLHPRPVATRRNAHRHRSIHRAARPRRSHRAPAPAPEIGDLHRRKPVRDHHGSPVGQHGGQRALHQPLAGNVQ